MIPVHSSSGEHPQDSVPFQRELRALPQPLHLFAYLTRGHHYHFGEFSDDDEPLGPALHRRALSCTRFFRRHGRLLDVGCGLGGSSSLLAAGGHRVLGIDPCRAAIAFARASLPPCERLDFVDAPFESRALESAGPFDGFLFLESLQHFASLPHLLARCMALASPEVVLVFSDAFTRVAHPRNTVPYHSLTSLEATAHGFGLEPLATILDGNAHSLRTLARLRDELCRRRAELVCAFEAGRPRIAAEIDELQENCRHLMTAFRCGDLLHGTLAFRRLG